MRSIPEPLVCLGGFLKQLRIGTVYDHFLLAARQDHPAGMTECRILFIITGHLQKVDFIHGIDDPANVAPVAGPGAHNAGLAAGIQRAVPQKLFAILLRGTAHQGRFGMTGAVFRDSLTVTLLHQNIAVRVSQQGAEGMIARGTRLL